MQQMVQQMIRLLARCRLDRAVVPVVPFFLVLGDFGKEPNVLLSVDWRESCLVPQHPMVDLDCCSLARRKICSFRRPFLVGKFGMK